LIALPAVYRCVTTWPLLASNVLMRNALFCGAALFVLTLLSGCSHKSHAFSSNEPEEPITGSSSDSPVDFKAELKPNVRYAFHLETDNTFRSSKWKFTGDSFTHFETDYRFSVTNEMRNGHRQLDLEILGLVVQVFYGDESKVYFDSENHAVPMVDEFADAMRSILHGHLGAELSRHDTLLRVTGLDQLANFVITNKKLRKQEAWIRRFFSTPTVRYMVEMNHLPEKPVKVGDKWHQIDDLYNGMQAESDYTFRGWQWHADRKCALIEFEGAIAMKGKSKSSVEDGKFYGRYWFDPQAGVMADSIIHEQWTMSRGKGADGEKLPTEQTVSVTLDSILGDSNAKPVASF
jgi:hypothetical protein